MLLVVTGLILLLQWLSCCHQVSVTLNEHIFTLCTMVCWGCFCCFARFILTFTCTYTCKNVAGIYLTFYDSACLKVFDVHITHYFMFYAWRLLLYKAFNVCCCCFCWSVSYIKMDLMFVSKSFTCSMYFIVYVHEKPWHMILWRRVWVWRILGG